MLSVKVTFADGNSFVTGINATLDEAKAYYIGQTFQFGDTEEHPEDLPVKAISVEEIEHDGALGREIYLQPLNS